MVLYELVESTLDLVTELGDHLVPPVVCMVLDSLQELLLDLFTAACIRAQILFSLFGMFAAGWLARSDCPL